ncbi:MAG: glycine betaine ABC transporter substrate-binding protein [Pleomorphochaeta sp.]
MPRIKKIVLFFLIIITFCFVSCDSRDPIITIGNKNFTEQRIIAEVLKQYLESRGFKVEVKELGGTLHCFNAIKSGDADLYCEYTGTTYRAIFGQTDNLSIEDTYNYVKDRCEEEFGITWLKPLGFNNTYVITVTQDLVNKYNLKTISDLKPIANNLVLGGPFEFAVREYDGYPALKREYGFEFKAYKAMDPALTTKALLNGAIDLNTYFSTDGRIAKNNFINLEDDKNVFPPYYCTPIMKVDFAKANSEVVKALNELENVISDKDMQYYNLIADEGLSIEETAKKLLEDKDLI